MIKALMADDSTRQPGVLELTIEGYIGAEAKLDHKSRDELVPNYRHEQVDMGAWDEDSDEEVRNRRRHIWTTSTGVERGVVDGSH